MKKLLLYGAQSIALSICVAIQEIYPEYVIEGFLVSSLLGNPSVLRGLPVRELSAYAKMVSEEERLSKHILIAIPENLHSEIAANLEKYGFYRYTCMDSQKEAKLLEEYFARTGEFAVLHKLLTTDRSKEKLVMQVFQAKFHKDIVLKNNDKLPDWMIPIQVGSCLTEKRIEKLRDDTGDHISFKNVNYCELTALYWLWKNHLSCEMPLPMKICQERVASEFITEMTSYYGLFHYRRILDITEEDLYRIKANQVDVVLPFPTMHEPDIKEHHKRYVKDTDWQAMLQALRELQPEYADAYEEIFSQQYLYNYNMIVAKKQVLADYCAWLFPILERIEELSVPGGSERADRYIGYIGENLLTLYFMYHRKDLNIVHTGRLMLI